MQTAQGYSLGAVDYILSPVRPDVLRSKVKVFVELFQMQQRTRAMAEAEVARVSAEEARRRANFLAHASHELGASLDLEQGMRRLLDLVVPHVCDAAAVTIEKEPQNANQRKDEFLAMLSHELRNPLAPIRNAVELMRRVGSTEQRLVMARDVIDRQATQLTRLVDELLDVSRISQGKIVLKKEPLELAKVITHSVETARPMIDQRDQRLSLEVSARPVWLQGDFARLSQAVANLLNNAAKYTPEGGRIRLTARASQGIATITVEDNGTGIDAELLPRVFELFVQGERGLDRSQGGLGIGLTQVKRL